MALTPMMQQYMEIKEKYQDCILFFRLGDFYEMFFEDAITASKEMEVTLTGKNCGQEERAPMCGVPFHAADTYIAKLVEKGYKVAICEQVEDPALAKGIVKREVIQVVTPGTVVSQTMLNEKENNYLASIYMEGTYTGLAFCDISTGEISTTEFHGKTAKELLLNELVKLKAKEILVNETILFEEFDQDIKLATDAYITSLNGGYYSNHTAESRILSQFNISSLKGIGLSEHTYATLALGALLIYLFETQKQNLSHLSHLKVYDTGKHMSLDKATIKNLELTETLFEKKVQGSLLGILDKTHTAMGSRKLKQWLREPLNSEPQIQGRLDAVELLFNDILMRNNLKESLKKIYDLERLCGRIACGNANGKDFIALKNSIFVLPDMKEELKQCENPLLEQLETEIHDLKSVYERIDSAIVEDPPYTIKEGGVIKNGFSEELDKMKESIKDGQAWIASLESAERERTGIKNLKVGYNKVFGYYLEVTKSYFQLVPENYIRKQTLANCERYVTPELKEVESVVLNAEAKINQMEYELFLALRQEIQNSIGTIQETSLSIAVLDVLVSFAETSSRLGYVKPNIHNGDEITIEKGRHPVIEASIKDGIFVSNDTYLDRKDTSMLLITGPNMAGKSTYMRQTALIVLLAQVGCFVPAERASIGIVDRIYTRIGASDNLAQGQSTFFVEMSELAYILNTATERSLVILDEIGRGTSTYDGLSIAWAVVEYLCSHKNHIRTLFATHYHELTSLEGNLEGVKNRNVDVSEDNGSIVFLHKIIPGSASRSYGIHVAKLAGVPSLLLQSAQEKLDELESESGELDLNQCQNSSLIKANSPQEEMQQLSLFDFAPNEIVKRLNDLDLMNLTPSEAFSILEDLKDAAEKSERSYR
ncbi:DNA mismatch repair protein MutS [Sinanaerobacter sp. ZZT-01]|uniref:DNA mismatch repair protein MutS n=1 Tax=Sinanaerobacter sp. ZZT-01 TaxID=3111540 RepID=UPI002D791B0C|nr:DNA mismatch repair protein MutS [Sinanaerobacter sp. ZZT-01]WRR93121.1 DNA mismatch repair protein MutS [Sinanaerobacter sp. ZZT-01]